MGYNFSSSPFWKLQQKFYNEAGPDAWRVGNVPHYITSNPVTAATYANIVHAFLRDRAHLAQVNEPVYIMEMGAGHGRFCYHFLKHLLHLMEGSSGRVPPFCYILTDFAESNLAYWKDHRRLIPFFEQGVLDYALFDANSEDDLQLRFSEKKITKGSLVQPFVIIANYIFDTIPQDLFFIENKQLHECIVEVTLPDDDQNGTATSELISHMTIQEKEHRLIPALPYSEKYLNDIVTDYIAGFEGASYLLFPHIALKCLTHLNKLSQAGSLLITADKGYHRLEELDHGIFPVAVLHGSLSYNVNYHAFKSFCEKQAGIALFPKHRHGSLNTGCLLLVPQAEMYTETLLAYERCINIFGPDEFFTLRQHLLHYSSLLHWPQLLAIIRLSNFDANAFSLLLPAIKEIISEASETVRWDLFQVIHKVWDMYYPMGEPSDLAFNLGILLFELQFYKEAIIYFNLSSEIYGEGHDQQYNIALCYINCGELQNAIDILSSLCKAFPDDRKALETLNYLQNQSMVIS